MLIGRDSVFISVTGGTELGQLEVNKIDKPDKPVWERCPAVFASPQFFLVPEYINGNR